MAFVAEAGDFGDFGYDSLSHTMPVTPGVRVLRPVLFTGNLAMLIEERDKPSYSEVEEPSRFSLRRIQLN